MKKSLLFFLFTCVIISSLHSLADSVEVGKKLPVWKPLLEENNDLSFLDTCKNKVLIIYHIDPRHKNENVDAIYAVRNAIVDKKLSLKYFQSIGIVDCDAAWQPNRMIKKYAIRENEKMPELHSLLLFDYQGLLIKKHGIIDKNLNAIVLVDKQNICRAIYIEKMTKEQITELVNMTVDLQYEPYKQPTTKKQDNTTIPNKDKILKDVK